MADKTANLGTEPWLWHDNGDGTYTPTVYNTGAGGAGGGDGAILDGASSSIAATVVDGATANPLLVSLVDQNGDAIAVGGGTQYAEDTASAAGEQLTMAGVVRKDAAATMVGADGDRTALQVDADGWLRVTTPPGGSGLTDAELRATPVPVSGTVTASDGGGSLTVDGTVAVTHAALTELAGAIDTEMQVDVVGALPAGDNNIGNVDVLTVPAPLSTTGGGTEATALRVTLANDSTGVVSVDDNGGSLTVDGPLTDAQLRAAVVPISDGGGSLTVDGTFWQATQPVSGTVTANQGSAGTAWEVVGDVAADIGVPTNPVVIGGRASTAVPTAVSADGDSVHHWLNRNGAVVVLQAPHIGLVGDPWSLVHEGVQYTTAQTSAVVVAGGASEKLVVTQVQIQAFSTTAGTAILYFGTGAYSRGTNRAIFDGEFAPSATLKPGVVLQGPFISGTNGDDLLFTSVGDIDVTISVWYYVVT